MASSFHLEHFHADAVVATGHDASQEPVLNLDEIQGAVLPGFGTSRLYLCGLKADDANGNADARRAYLRTLARYVSTARQAQQVREVRRAVARASGAKPALPDVFLSVSLSFHGALGLALPVAGISEPLFKFGMAAAVNQFQDPVDSQGKPVGWKLGGTPDTSADIFLTLGSDSDSALSHGVTQLTASLAGSGFRAVYEENGAALPGSKEHFGFRDDISHPGVRGRLSERPDHVLTRRYLTPDDPRYKSYARPGQPLIWPGQFIFGYPTQQEGSSDPGPTAIPPEPWMKNGSFLVFRRLRQDVAAFQAFAERQAAHVSAQLGRTVSAAKVQAWVVGRWPDGTPLVRSPNGPNPAVSGDDQQVNFFSYLSAETDARVVEDGTPRTVPGSPDDQLGLVCPHFAHVRKVNLRGATDLGELTRFLILRRGIPYGPAYEPGEPAGTDRGLLFLAYMRSFQVQFRTLTQTWMNSKAAPEGFGHDLLVGQNRAGRTADRSINGTLVTLESTAGETWVIPTGGGFLFTPAVSVLANL